MSGLILDIGLEGDEAGKRCDKRAYTADVYTEEELAVVIRKLREEDCRGDVAYHLTGESREDKRVHIEKRGEEGTHDVDPCHISRENKEEYEGEEQAVIYTLECLAVEEKERYRNDDKTDDKRNRTEYDKYREREERKEREMAERLQAEFAAFAERLRKKMPQEAHSPNDGR